MGTMSFGPRPDKTGGRIWNDLSGLPENLEQRETKEKLGVEDGLGIFRVNLPWFADIGPVALALATLDLIVAATKG